MFKYYKKIKDWEEGARNRRYAIGFLAPLGPVPRSYFENASRIIDLESHFSSKVVSNTTGSKPVDDVISMVSGT